MLNDLISKLFTRRQFVTSSVGYALAVSPVTAWAKTTSAKGLTTGDIKISTGKETMPGFFASPKKPGHYPVVIVVHEIFGIHEYIRDVCRRLADAGYFAVAPYLYFRQGDATKIADIDALRAQIISKVSQPVVLTDLDATVAWIGKQKAADSKKIGITGFCWGGTAVWMYAHHNPSIKAGVAWYGRLTGDKTPNQAVFPTDIAFELKVPVLGLYGGKDKGIPIESIERMRGELKKGKTPSEIIVYPDADHGFHADYRPTYNEKAADEGWKQLLAWFKKYGLF